MKYFEYLFFLFQKFLASVIPFGLMYIHSDVNAFFVQHIFRYRLKTVTNNIRNSFPEKDEKEIKNITDNFYRNLCDTAVESLKGYSMNISQLQKRYLFKNIVVANQYYERGRDIILVLSHYCNWEWGSQIADNVFKHLIFAFYKPLSNAYIDKHIVRLRTKRNINLLSVDTPGIPVRSQETKLNAYVFISDQNPGRTRKVIWTRFLNQDTACFRGVEVYAKHFNMPVIYVEVQRTRRGFYTVELEVLTDEPTQTTTGEITEKYMKKLESIIVKRPEDWLWSHRRWKLRKVV